jgi:hypothetical protein
MERRGCVRPAGAVPLRLPRERRDHARRQGPEFVSRLTLYTERADIKRGDRVALGDIEDTDPIAAGAREVRGVTRFGDTLDRKADDYVVGTV